MPRNPFPPPQLSRPGLRGQAQIPHTWDECVQRALRTAQIEAASARRHQADPWQRKIHSLLACQRYARRISRVPPKEPRLRSPPTDWEQCIRTQRNKMKALRSAAQQPPWDRAMRRKIVGLCIRSRVSEWRIRMNVTQQQLRLQLRQQDYTCALTGRPLTPETATIDHLQPLNRGGQHTIENLRFVHVDANRAKGTLTLDEFVALCAEVVTHHRVAGDGEKPKPRTWDEWAAQQVEVASAGEHKQEEAA